MADATLDEAVKAAGLDPFSYARDHAGGPGAWCVVGPNGFKVPVGEKSVAYMVGKLLSGKTEEAERMAKNLAAYAESRPATSITYEGDNSEGLAVFRCWHSGPAGRE